MEESPDYASSQAFAKVEGTLLTEAPTDLYIPPEALQVFLETFEGPLDLLLYLIKKQNLDILDIPIAGITEQYMSYIDVMQELKLELAAEYLLMAAMLAEIKSRMLLPQRKLEEEESDPRAELVRRLQEYERYQKASATLEDLPRMGREWQNLAVDFERVQSIHPPPEVELEVLVRAFQDVLHRLDMESAHLVERETLSVRARMSSVLSIAKAGMFTAFYDFFTAEEGRPGAIVTLIAVLELLKESMIEIVEAEKDGLIYIKVVV